jgi:hypothetical protein
LPNIRAAVLVVGTTLAWPSLAAAQRSRFPADSVHVVVAVTGDTAATVSAHLRLAAAVRTADFTYLARACTRVSALTVARPPLAAGIASDTSTPWVAIHDTTELAPDASLSAYEIRYDVSWTGDTPRIPLVMPAAPLGAAGSTPSSVVIEVTLADSATRVVSPRMRRTGQRWSSTLAAIPSTIVLSRPAPGRDASCDKDESSGGDAGSFHIRFALLLATMGVWVPLYFVWAARARGHEDPPGESGGRVE